ncbi:MAG: serine/threonine protein kinase [Gammaproteobacteria bacterium]|nr:serine/threonine protein kinase [Gammaproteobacteria bacterium]
MYRARHTALNRSVALKVLLAEHEGSEVLRERFRREAETLAALSHPHIVAVTDFGVDGEMMFLVMELLEGRTLAELLRATPIEPRRGLAIVRQVLLALGYAHARGVVHRDLKPHNVFVRELDDGSDHVTVLDFGLARMLGQGGADARQLTRAGMLIGTPAYMAPEQASGDVDAIDARTDVYAAGLVLYEVLTRRRPFPGSEPGKLLRAHLLQDPPAAPRGRSVPHGARRAAGDRHAGAREEPRRALRRRDGDARRARRRRRRGAAPRRTGGLDRGERGRVVRQRGDAGRLARRGAGATERGLGRGGPRAAGGGRARRRAGLAGARSRAPIVIGLALALGAIGAIAAGVVLFLVPDSPGAAELPEAPRAPEPVAPASPPPPAAPTDAARDPFEDPLPEPMASLHAHVARGRSLSRSQVRQVRSWARENGDDVRARLLLGHSYTNERALSYALPEYEAAMARDRTARGDPEMLPDLLEMAVSNALARRASDRIVEWYGADAVAGIDAALRGRLRPEEERRLQALRARAAAAR